MSDFNLGSVKDNKEVQKLRNEIDDPYPHV